MVWYGYQKWGKLTILLQANYKSDKFSLVIRTIGWNSERQLAMANRYSSFWIIGAGRFGKKAADRIARKYPKAILKVLDKNPQNYNAIKSSKIEFLHHEGASYLASQLDAEHSPDWIIPAIPIHLAMEWVRLKVMGNKSFNVIKVPTALETLLPNPIRGEQGQLFVSYADFMCPENCTEPFERCTFTGKPRKGFIYKDLKSVVFEDFRSVVIRSYQLAPGVGGYPPAALRQALDEVLACSGPVLLSTACFCHGVIHALEVS
jgi:hypothetical protein